MTRLERHHAAMILPAVLRDLANAPGASGAWRGELVAWGAHGGAGTSTVAGLLGACWDMGALRRRADPDPRFPAVVTYGRPLIVVCRNTVAAAERATAAVMGVTQPGGRVDALAIVADGAGREPREAAARFRLLESRVGRVVRVPFLPALRLVDDPSTVPLPRRMEQAIEQLRALAAMAPSAPEAPPAGQTITSPIMPPAGQATGQPAVPPAVPPAGAVPSARRS